MKFFKFIDNDDCSLSHQYQRLHYVKGEELKVENYDPSVINQCSAGIHCIYMEGKDPIQTYNIIFGPKVAILEAEKEDVIYFATDGKCRLKQCKVIDVIKTGDLPVKFLVGNGDTSFADSAITYIEDIDNKVLDEINKSDFDKTTKDHIFYKLAPKVRSYDAKTEKILVDLAMFDIAVKNSIKHKKYFNPIIREKVLSSYIQEKIAWVKIFGRDPDIDNSIYIFDIIDYVNEVGHSQELRDKIVNYGDSSLIFKYSLVYTDDEIENLVLENSGVYNLISYAIKWDKNTKEIRDKIIDYCGNDSYHNDYFLSDYVIYFCGQEGIENIAELSSKSSIEYFFKTGNITGKMRENISRNIGNIMEITRRMKVPEFYPEIGQYISYSIEFLSIYGFDEEFLNFIDVNDSYYNNSYQKEKLLNLIRTNRYNAKVEKMFMSCFPVLYNLIEYCYHWGYNNIVKEYIQKKNYSIEDLLYCMRKYGYFPFMEDIFNLIAKEETREEDYKKFTDAKNIFFKVVRTLKNGTKVSAFVSKDSKMRKTYCNGGEYKVVDKCMVFSDYFTAKRFCDAYSDLRVYSCTGENFKPVERIVNWKFISQIDQKYINMFYRLDGYYIKKFAKDNGISIEDLVNVELPGSGWLENVELL